MPYRVFVGDNFHYRESDPEERGRVFQTSGEALAYCRVMVDDYLGSTYQPGMQANALMDSYCMFGEDPFIKSEGSAEVEFSAWDYALRQCQEMCGDQDGQ